MSRPLFFLYGIVLRHVCISHIIIILWPWVLYKFIVANWKNYHNPSSSQDVPDIFLIANWKNILYHDNNSSDTLHSHSQNALLSKKQENHFSMPVSQQKNKEQNTQTDKN
jgi:hypothetical protein